MKSACPPGLILLHKEPGITSFDALGTVKRRLASGKVGHTGTLDKFASGLLLVLTGKALRLSSWFTGCAKEYEGCIRFGEETDTLDPEGQPVAGAPIPSREAVEEALPQFTGEILQAPPVYSAIHINGKRAHELARSGQAPEMKKRPVTIYRLELRSWEPPLAKVFVRCSSGTYIRSLARDLAVAAGSRAHLSALTRTAVAGFRLEDASSGDGELRPLPIDRAVINTLGLPCFDLPPESLREVMQGKPIARILDRALPAVPRGDVAGEPFSAALFCGETFAGIAEKRAGEKGESLWGYGCVFV